MRENKDAARLSTSGELEPCTLVGGKNMDEGQEGEIEEMRLSLDQVAANPRRAATCALGASTRGSPRLIVLKVNKEFTHKCFIGTPCPDAIDCVS